MGCTGSTSRIVSPELIRKQSQLYTDESDSHSQCQKTQEEIDELQSSLTVLVLDTPVDTNANNCNNNTNSNSSTQDAPATRSQVTLGHIIQNSEQPEAEKVHIQLEEPPTPNDRECTTVIVGNAISNAVRTVEEEEQVKQSDDGEEAMTVIDLEKTPKQNHDKSFDDEKEQPGDTSESTEKDKVLWTSPAFATTAEKKEKDTEENVEHKHHHRHEEDTQHIKIPSSDRLSSPPPQKLNDEDKSQKAITSEDGRPSAEQELEDGVTTSAGQVEADVGTDEDTKTEDSPHLDC